MFSLRIAPLLVSGLLAAASTAQTQDTTRSSDHGPDRSFVLVQGSSMHSFQNSWQSGAPLLRYAHDHPGTYVVFEQGDELYRLDSPERLAEVQRLYAPMQQLAEKQQALAHAQQALAQGQQKLASAQQPLAQHQQDLAKQQSSTQDPKDQGQLGRAQGVIGQEQGDLGSVQGDLGRQQGDLGAVQGEIGRKQSELARSINKRLQVIFTECLADGSCPRATS